MKGTVKGPGGDWVTSRPDGSALLDVRLLLETDDGAVILMQYKGILTEGGARLRTAPLFETGDERYAWLNTAPGRRPRGRRRRQRHLRRLPGAVAAPRAGPSVTACPAASWPQAASMSVPRLRRMVAFTPRATRRSRNSRTPLADVPFVGQPGVGLSGIRLTWGARGRVRPRSASSLGVVQPVVHAVDQRPLEAQPAALGLEVAGAGRHQRAERVAAVDRARARRAARRWRRGARRPG